MHLIKLEILYSTNPGMVFGQKIYTFLKKMHTNDNMPPPTFSSPHATRQQKYEKEWVNSRSCLKKKKKEQKRELLNRFFSFKTRAAIASRGMQSKTSYKLLQQAWLFKCALRDDEENEKLTKLMRKAIIVQAKKNRK